MYIKNILFKKTKIGKENPKKDKAGLSMGKTPADFCGLYQKAGVLLSTCRKGVGG